MNLYDKHPVISADAFIAPNATVIGRVDVNKASSVWYGAVVRGEWMLAWHGVRHSSVGYQPS